MRNFGIASRVLVLAAAQAAFVLGLAGCGGGGGGGTPTPPATATRTWMTGVSAFPPRPQVADVLRTIDLASQRTELLIIHEELPWTDLLAGIPAKPALAAWDALHARTLVPDAPP